MSGLRVRLFLFIVFWLSSLGAAGIGLVEPVQAADERDAQAREWEQQVATDARGDVWVHWPGSIDLFYMTMGELYSITLGEPFLFVRIGYNATAAGEEDIQQPENPVPPGAVPLPPVPGMVPQAALSTINITFNISGERSVRIGLFSVDAGENWLSDQGPLVGTTEDVRGHSEVIYIAPLRRFDLQNGDTLTDYNITAHRERRVTDTMQAFEPLADYAPNYPRAHRMIDRLLQGPPLEPPVPLPVPLPPFPPEPPVPLPEPPVPLPEPSDVVPDEPLPDQPELGPQGLPPGVPTPKELRDWDPTDPDRGDEGPPVQPERLTEEPGKWPSSRATNASHKVTDGTGRLVTRAEQQAYTASFNHVAWANFTVESRMTETDQRVLMLGAGLTGTQWMWRYGLDMPLGIKDLPAGGTTRMSLIGVPNSLFASAVVFATAIFITDWGGIDLSPVTLYNTNAPVDPGLVPLEDVLPRRIRVDLVNEEDPFRVNEVRKVMVRVRTETFQSFPYLEAVRAYIYPAGTQVPEQPYQMREKDFMAGMYEIDFVFHKPGAWIVRVYFFDYPATASGNYPNIEFIVHVEPEPKTDPIIPFPAALGSMGLLMLAFVARERMSKAR